MATPVAAQCNNKSTRREDELSFGFTGGGGDAQDHTTTITLDGSSTSMQLAKPLSGTRETNHHLQQQHHHHHHQADRPTLVDLLIDSQCDWRQLISEANGPHVKLTQHFSEIQIKRQEIIHELIQTERHHCLTLALMRQVYLAGLLRLNELRQRDNSTGGSVSGASGGQQQVSGTSTTSSADQQASSSQRLVGEPIDIERLFPALEELIQAHELFFAHLRLRLVECCQSPGRQNQPLVGIIGPLGDLLIEQFKLGRETNTNTKRHKLKCHAQSMTSNMKHEVRTKTQKQQSQQQQQQQSQQSSAANTNGYKLLQAYAKFCGQHYESSRYYKQLLQFDKEFKQFIEQCNKQHAACRQRGIPECNLLVAQRLTKYPLLIEQLIKASKGEPNDEEEKLRQALGECRALLAELNSQLARKESFERLLDIYAQFSPKSHTIFYHKSALKFTKHDLLQHKRLRQLLHWDDQVRIWSATRRKLFPVLCLILNDIIVFLRIDQQQQEQQISSSQQAAVATAVSRLHHLDGGRDDSHDGHEMAATATAAAAAANQSGLTTTNNSYLQQPPAPGSTSAHHNAPTVRYYFANIDNKSSVISLSKLLVREKAVEEAEPRVYLISSSPKQPEMYELAFVSRRHQTTFIDKLKTTIETHNKFRLSDLTCSGRGRNFTTLGGYWVECAAEASSGSSECCSLTSCSSSASSGSSSSAASCSEGSGAAGSEFPSDVDDVDYDQDVERNDSTHMVTGGGTNEPVTAQVTVVDMENLKLDIEQDLVPAPSCLDLTTCDVVGRQEDEQVVRAESATPSSGAQVGETGLSERARDSCDDLSSPRLWMGQGCRRQKARGNRKRRFQRPRQVSNQSTDSGTTSGTSLTSGIGSGDCLEFGGTTTTCSQSSLQSPRPSSESSSGKQLFVCEPDSTSGDDNANAQEAGEAEEDLDSGRGRDDCSSSSSSSSSSSAASTCHDSMTTTGGGQQPEVETDHPGGQSPKSPQESSSGAPSSPKVTTTIGITASDQQHQQQQQVGHKQHLLKQRKLSTVSTISSQMKLLQKLRSVGLLATTGGQQGDHLQVNNGRQAQPATPLSLCANCIHQQQQRQHDALDDTIRGTGGSMSKRHLQHLRQLSKRRSLFVPEQKLEELRNLRIQLDKDKQEWQEKFDRMQEQLLNERRDLDLARERLKLDRTQIENEREQLYRKLEILKENGILLSPSHKVIITSPDQCARLMSASQVTNHYQPLQQQQHFQHQGSQRLYQAPNVYGNHQQQQQQQQAGYGQHPPLMMQQQQPVAASAKVPVHLSQQRMGGQQQHYAPSNRTTSSGGFMSVLPGASFLVKRFGGGGGGVTQQPPVNVQPINGKLSQSTLTISHNHLQQQQQQLEPQNHFANKRNHVLL